MKSALRRMGLLTAFFLITVALWSQTGKLTGHITAEDGQPLQGVSILIKGKATGTQTDVNGAFTLTATIGDVLLISYSGYTAQQLALRSLSPLQLSLKPDAGKLGEVVVVGYGTQSRRNITSAIS